MMAWHDSLQSYDTIYDLEMTKSGAHLISSRPTGKPKKHRVSRWTEKAALISNVPSDDEHFKCYQCSLICLTGYSKSNTPFECPRSFETFKPYSSIPDSD